MTKYFYTDCLYCHTRLKRYNKTKKGHYCNLKCKGSYQREFVRGKNHPLYGRPGLFGSNNPNNGNKWTEEQKKRGSEISKKRMEDPRMRELAGSANRGKKFSKELIERMHGQRNSDSYSHPHKEETKKVIAEKSKNKWTKDYKKRNRKIREELGYWIPLSKKI